MPESAQVTAGLDAFAFGEMATLRQRPGRQPGGRRASSATSGSSTSIRTTCAFAAGVTPTDVEATKLRFRPATSSSASAAPISGSSRSPTSMASARRHAMVLRARSRTCVLPEFLPFFMQSDRVHGARACDLGRVALADDQLDDASPKYEFALPPLEEQRRIAVLLLQLRVETLQRLR